MEMCKNVNFGLGWHKIYLKYVNSRWLTKIILFLIIFNLSKVTREIAQWLEVLNTIIEDPDLFYTTHSSKSVTAVTGNPMSTSEFCSFMHHSHTIYS